MKEAGGPAVSGHPPEFIFCSQNGTFWGTLKTCFREGAEAAGSPHHYMDKPLNLSDPDIFLWEFGTVSALLSLPWLRG